jgi:CcmD family protein
MTIHPALPQDTPGDSTQATAYDSVWTGREEVPSQQPVGLERVMLADGKIYVVLAVVLIIWFGLVAFLFRTDRKLDRLERDIDLDISEWQSDSADRL